MVIAHNEHRLCLSRVFTTGAEEHRAEFVVDLTNREGTLQAGGKTFRGVPCMG